MRTTFPAAVAIGAVILLGLVGCGGGGSTTTSVTSPTSAGPSTVTAPVSPDKVQACLTDAGLNNFSTADTKTGSSSVGLSLGGHPAVVGSVGDATIAIVPIASSAEAKALSDSFVAKAKGQDTQIAVSSNGLTVVELIGSVNADTQATIDRCAAGD
jgi:hypothetical protein